MHKNLVKLAITAALFGGSAHAVNLTAPAFCATCKTVNDLTTATQGWIAANYATVGTHVLMTSAAAPISMLYKVVLSPRGHPMPVALLSCTTTQQCNQQAYNLDSQIYARGAKIEPITVPLPYTATPDQVEQALVKQIYWTGGEGAQDLHWLGADFPVIGFFSVSVNSGPTQYLFIGDLVKVVFGTSGYSMLYLFTNMSPPAPFTKGQPMFKPYGNLMYKGKPVKPPSTVPAIPMPNKNPATYDNGTYPNVGTNFYSQVDLTACYGISSISITFPDGTVLTSYGFYDMACTLP